MKLFQKMLVAGTAMSLIAPVASQASETVNLEEMNSYVRSEKSSSRIDGAKGLKLSLNFTFKLRFFCIVSERGSAKIDLDPKALGPNSILP